MHAPDHSVRQQALDASQSFLVQAPAGSGKTELLTQRLLVLLARVEQPEHIIAMTFTKKAAAEMRERLISALRFAQETQQAPESAHKRLTWQLAKAVLAQDAKHHWHLLSNPSRLRLMTIDSLCAYLTHQMPVLSGLGAGLSISESPTALYEKAVDQLLQTLDDTTDYQQSLMIFLQHLDNRFDIAKRLLINMLAQRDQWLGVVLSAKGDADLRVQLESAFAEIVHESIGRLRDLFGDENIVMFERWLALDENPPHPGPLPRGKRGAPYLAFWQAIATLLLTAKGTFRKNIDKRCNRPNLLDNAKNEVKTFLAEMADQEDFAQALFSTLSLPAVQFEATQWQVLDALLTLLPVLSAQLRVVFEEAGQVDFAQVSISALQALGEIDNPTDLALRLDYQIQHILVDEFQDTSQTQYELLTKLTAGWQQGDGRTLFCVGDPMQSIYRFRQADVSLFLHVKAHGISQVVLTFLQLIANFRSETGVIDWVNRVFPKVMPAHDDELNGAIAYSPSMGMHPNTSDQHVNWHVELQGLVQQITDIKKAKPHETVAILVRSRTHLLSLLPLLREANLAYQAVDIESLADSLVIQDLLSLTFALDNTADRLSWLSLMRTPWIGLDLKDLTRLSIQADQTIWDAMQDPAIIDTLSSDGQRLIRHVVPVFQEALTQRGRVSWPQLIYQTWIDLSGLACLQNEDEFAAVEVYFETLSDTVAQSNQYIDREALIQNINLLKAQQVSIDNNPIQVMTIHKSKGLEFDTVIMLALDKRSRVADRPILLWENYRTDDHQLKLLMAPLHARNSSDRDAMYQYLLQREQQKDQAELMRLLYVAVTRAKKRLLLQGQVQWDEKTDQPKTPVKSSLLGLLWHEARQYALANGAVDQDDQTGVQVVSKLMRMKNPLQTLSPNPFPAGGRGGWASGEKTTSSSGLTGRSPDLNHPALPDWQVNPPANIGTIVHEYLALFSTLSTLPEANQLHQYQPNIHIRLKQAGILNHDELNQADKQIVEILKTGLNDPEGRWILSPHDEAYSEYPLQEMAPDGVTMRTSILDRVLIDHAKKYIWIIDYKTSVPNPDESLDVFAKREGQYYYDQLDRYAMLIERLYPGYNVKAGLYFVAVPHFEGVLS